MAGGGEESIGALFSRLRTEGMDFARAELRLVRARVSGRAALVRSAVILLVAAALLAIGALIALLVGLIATLSVLIGPGWATLVVVGGTLLVAGILGALGAAALRKAFSAEAVP
jgi:hypothetical protein